MILVATQKKCFEYSNRFYFDIIAGFAFEILPKPPVSSPEIRIFPGNPVGKPPNGNRRKTIVKVARGELHVEREHAEAVRAVELLEEGLAFLGRHFVGGAGRGYG